MNKYSFFRICLIVTMLCVISPRSFADTVFSGTSILKIRTNGVISNGSFSDQLLSNVLTEGAFCDGTTHPLSEKFANLSAAQVDFPLATSLGQEIDGVVIEKLINDEQDIYIPKGICLLNHEIIFANKEFSIRSHKNGVIKASADNNYMFRCTTNCNITFKGVDLDGNNQVFNLVRADFSSWNGIDNYYHNIGNLDALAPILAAGLYIDDPLNINIKGLKGRVINALGDGVFGNGVGAARFLVLGNGSVGANVGYAIINNLDLDAEGSDAEELDLFQINIDNIQGGVISDVKLKYNGNVRRCMKFMSGRWDIYGLHVSKSADFVADSALTDVGDKNLHCIDWTHADAGRLHVHGGYVDGSGFKVALANSGGTADVLFNGLYVKGGQKRVIRAHPETDSAIDTEHVAFFTAGTGFGSGLMNSKIENFTMAVKLQGDFSYVKNNIFINPVEFAAYVGTSSQRKNMQFSDNKIITQTSGYLNSGRIIRVLDVLNLNINRNELIFDGNTNTSSYFIQFTDADTTGRAAFNLAPSGVTAVSVGSAAVDLFEY